MRGYRVHMAVRFQVCDSGIGMSPDDIHKRFQPFTQLDETTTRKNGGTGLGLAISQCLCHLMGGAMTMASTLGQGSTFTMFIPTQPHQCWQTTAQGWRAS